MNEKLKHRAFIPKWMDEADLTPIQFRVLAHLWRRAGPKMTCWPGAESIREACRISDDSLWSAVKVLEQRGFLRREKRRYNSNHYVLIIPDVTQENRVTLLPVETGEQSPAKTGCESPAKTGEPLPGKGGCKGISGKVLYEGTTGGGSAALPPDAPVSFPWKAISDLPTELRMKLSAVYPHANDQADVFTKVRGRKLRYKDRHVIADWAAVFIADLEDEHRANRANKPLFGEGRNSRQCSQTNDYSGVTEKGDSPNTASRSAEEDDAPTGWQAWFAREYPGTPYAPGGAHYTVDWRQLDATTQQFIRRELKGAA